MYVPDGEIAVVKKPQRKGDSPHTRHLVDGRNTVCGVVISQVQHVTNGEVADNTPLCRRCERVVEYRERVTRHGRPL